ncbi:serine hydrolase [Paenibacillus sp. 598K]|uniref:serine hydrolase domain-containing protein n=1 Tax=Paenibacillus sp. 598K TaxID=1117987 RepID=UPI000FF98557|nr:serine hydrolase domain-containing protein [Paenibacillus sp. 598K]GBF73679.1 serine hydrolase [Paenibacillus sp. 598K]
MILILRIATAFAMLAGGALGLLTLLNRPLSRGAVTAKLQQQLDDLIAGNDELSSALLTIYSPRTGYREQFAAGVRTRGSVEPARVDSPYHSASIGKMLCAAVFGILADEGKLRLDDPIRNWLDDRRLAGLFLVDGVDYSSQVTVRHLLTHTSGAGDYFAGPVTSGRPLLEQIVADPDRLYAPDDLLAFTREHQQPVGRPGEQFAYSDTGYVLLGFILEAIEGKRYAEIMKERIFEPLGMHDSYVKERFPDLNEALAVYVDGVNLNGTNALSVDWAGGGIMTTMDDLLLFMQAWTQGALVSDAVYEQMTDFRQRFDTGIRYGMGMMYFDFSELSWLLRGMSDLYGGVGSTGTYALYDPTHDTYYIANYGSLHYTPKAIRHLVKLRMLYARMQIEE